MKLSGESKFLIGIVLVTVILVIGGIFFLSRPAPAFTCQEILTSDSYKKGNEKARNCLIEFSDFQCPACGSFYPQVKNVVEDNKDNLVFAYRHCPLDQHEQAWPAALAAEAAGEQGKFWEMHDYIFENQENLSEQFLLEAAEKLGLDKENFEAAYKEKKYQDKINRDLTDGRKFGVDATPTFFLNGKKLNLFSRTDLDKAVEEAIKK